MRILPRAAVLSVLVITAGVAPVSTVHALRGAQTTTTSAWCGNFAGITSTTILAGTTTRQGGSVKAGGNPVQYEPVQLWARPYNATWRQVKTSTTGPTGNINSVLDAPRRNTTYQWRFAGTEEYGPSTSNLVSVRVATKVSIRLSDSSVRPGQRIVVSGGTAPAKPGFTATVWRRLPGRSVKLASGTVRSDGTYRVPITVRGDTRFWNVYVTVPAGAGNVRGTSTDRSISIG